MTRALVILSLLLAACARPAPSGAGWRSAAVPIRSIALFDATRLDGDWREVAGFALRPARTCRPGAWSFGGGGSRIGGSGCYLPLAGPAGLAPAGPGRLRAAGVDLWVLWVDADYRTLVIGTPSGRFAAVLNRGGAIADDRLTAARNVLQFNGYDLSNLEISP